MADLTPRVFISHADADDDVARRIANDLEAMDVNVWREAAITPANKSLTSLREEIRTSDVLLVLVSRASVESDWAGEELDATLLAEFNERAITVVPALLGGSELPEALAGRQYLDLRDDIEGGLRRLAEQISVAPEVDFARLTPQEFEQLVSTLVQDLGFDVQRERSGPDRGYDLTARGPEGKLVMVEAKHYGHARVDLASINRLVGAAALNGIDRVLLVTSGQLTSAARQYIEEVTNDSLVEVGVLDRTTLTGLLLQRPELARRFFDRP